MAHDPTRGNFFDRKPEPEPKPRARKPAPIQANGRSNIKWLPGQWREDLAKSDKGNILRTLGNTLVALRQAPQWQGMFAWNEFSARCMLMRYLPNTADSRRKPPHEITEPDLTNVTDWMQDNGIVVTSQTVAEAIRAVADENSYHPVREYLTTLAWDGTERLDTWLSDHLGAADTPLHRAFSAKWMIGLVARAFEPGCQFDTAIIFEGPQGLRKSTSARVLTEPWFTDHMPDLASKDALEQLQGVWVVEFSDLSTLRRAETNRIKSFLSARIDRFRPSFGRFAADYPRQCGFCGTVNPGSNGYLRDETGARRFWTVACGEGWEPRQQVDLKALGAARDQLWAEAVHRYRDGEPWWLNTEDLEKDQEDAAARRQIDDPREPKVSQFVEGRTWVRMDQILGGECLNIPPERWTTALRMEIGAVMVTLKWRRKRKRTIGDKFEWRYYPMESTDNEDEADDSKAESPIPAWVGGNP